MSQDIIDRFPTSLLGEIVEHNSISAGLSGATVLSVSTDQGRFIVRRFHGSHADWQMSLVVLRKVSEAKIAPRVVYTDDDSQTLISEEIQGQSIAHALADAGARQLVMASLMSTLRRLHDIELDDIGDRDTIGSIKTLWSSQWQREGFMPWAEPLALKLKQNLQRASADKRRVLCHGDLNPNNILWDGQQVYLVDWDLAGPGHPYVDFASLSCFLGLPFEAACSLLGMQETQPLSQKEQAVFSAWLNIAQISYGCAFLHLVGSLNEIDVPSLQETPALAACFGQLMTGKMSMDDARSRLLIAAAFFKQALAAESAEGV